MGTKESPRDRESERPDPALRRGRSHRRRRPKPVQGLEGKRPRLSRRTGEMLTLIGINAALSLVISLAVVIAWDTIVRAPASTSTPIAVATDTATPIAALPTATFTPGPGAPITYRVQAGDTLLTIAAQFGVTWESIMVANGLENPNFIQIGQELIVPVGGLPASMPTATVEPPLPQATDTPAASAVESPEPTATPLPTSSPTDTPTPPPFTPPATEPEVTIRQVLGAGALDDEAVSILNGGRAVRMQGWTLTDTQENVYTFPNLFLGAGGGVRVHTGPGSNSATDLYWGLDAPVWGEPGDVATLRDESGLVVDRFELP